MKLSSEVDKLKIEIYNSFHDYDCDNNIKTN